MQLAQVWGGDGKGNFMNAAIGIAYMNINQYGGCSSGNSLSRVEIRIEMFYVKFANY
jgi:hypothetical protein